MANIIGSLRWHGERRICQDRTEPSASSPFIQTQKHTMTNTFRPTYIQTAVCPTRTGYTVGIVCREPGEDMWENMAYYRRDLSEEQALRLEERILERRTFNLYYWYWTRSVCAQYGFMHERPRCLTK